MTFTFVHSRYFCRVIFKVINTMRILLGLNPFKCQIQIYDCPPLAIRLLFSTQSDMFTIFLRKHQKVSPEKWVFRWIAINVQCYVTQNTLLHTAFTANFTGWFKSFHNVLFVSYYYYYFISFRWMDRLFWSYRTQFWKWPRRNGYPGKIQSGKEDVHTQR